MTELVDVAVAVPLFRTFSYRVPAGATTHVGQRVVVPFRGRREVGIVLGSATAEPGIVYKEISALSGDRPTLDPPLLATCRWIASHYAAPIGITLRAALPAALADPARKFASGRRQRIICASRRLDSLLERDRAFRRAPKQRAVFEYLETLTGPVPVDHVVKAVGVSFSVLQAMADRDLVTIEHSVSVIDPLAARQIAGNVVHNPTPAQADAIARLSVLGAGDVALLHGVTGSGKTLVYLETLRRRLAANPQATAIVLVPEIALTPQTVDRFRAVFGDAVAVMHSALSDAERYAAWDSLRSGGKRIAVGARSAVFAPLSSVTMIVVDEEHEASYKQGETPRYHARDVAIVRARHEGAAVVLGSATPSLESWSRTRTGTAPYHLVELRDRVGGGELPAVVVVDLRDRNGAPRGASPETDLGMGPPPESQITPSPSPSRQRAVPPAPPPPGTRDPFRRVFSQPLETALRERLDRREQSLLLLNRRGYASFLQCRACGEVAQCPNCSVAMTYHRNPDRLTCHYCAHTEAPRTECTRCGQLTIRQLGLGTQQVERLVIERFPTARVARMDVDTTSGKWAHLEILDRVGSGEVDILLGTQMIAKGLDFPNVTLVGVIDADIGLNIPDFRASERTFQLLAQVAGRAGRSEKIGHVIIQSRQSDAYSIQCALRHDFHAFVEEELRARRAPAYPPHVHLAHVVLSGPDHERVAAAAQDAATWLSRLIEARGVTGVRVVGPAMAPIERIQQRWRWRFFLRAERASTLTRITTYLAQRYEPPTKDVRLVIDRDPVSML